MRAIVRDDKNISFRFFNPEKSFSGLELSIKHKDVYTDELYYRFIIPQMFVNCKKLLVVDADIIVTENLANLYNENVNGYLAAGVISTVYQEWVKTV